MRLWIGAAFILIIAAELAVLFAVEDQIGWPWSAGIIAATGVLGSILVRSQGVAVYMRIREGFGFGTFPVAELAHGALVVFGGALLLTPGFLTDLVGLSLMVLPTREAIRVRALRWFQARI
jgi:UPF0716 protein FxsA